MNPFILSGYKDKRYFCDRQVETQRIINAIENSRNLTLVSERKLGKTALLSHVQHSIKNEVIFIYIDLYPTQELKDLIKILANAIIQKLEPFSEKVLRNITQFFKSINPKFSIDPQSGSPNLELSINTIDDAEQSIHLLFKYIRNTEKKVTIAFDEFQQILNYPEKNMEALLRSEIQKNNNSCFIFSGSYTHLLLSIFNEYSRPFYQSTEILELKKIDKEKYAPFISKHFEINDRKLSLSEAEYIYKINRGITYNIQYLSNKLFSSGETKINSDFIDQTLMQILKENEITYYNYRELLSKLHFKLLKAVAKEEIVLKPLSNSFLQKHKLGSASSVKSAITILQKKGIVINNKGLRVSDWFFSLWLSRLL